MICECQCDNIIINTSNIPQEDIKPNTTFSKKYYFSGSIYITPKLNRFIERIENIDEIKYNNKYFSDSKKQSGKIINRKYINRTYPVISIKNVDTQISFETNSRNMKRIEYENKITRSVFNSYSINLFDKEVFFNKKSLEYFFDEATDNTCLKLLNENIEDPILHYPIEFTNNTLHRQGGRIEIFDIVKDIKNYSINGDYKMKGAKANLSVITRTFNEILDNKIIETQKNISYYDEGIIPDLIFNHSKTKNIISNNENFFIKNERNILPYTEIEFNDFNLKSIFNSNIKYTSSGRSIDYNISNFSESLSYEGLLN